MIDQPFMGMQYLLDGFALIATRGLRRFAIIPLIINILLFIGFFLVLRHFMGEFNAWFATFLPNWLLWLSWVLWILFFVSYFVVLLYTFVTIANLVCAPFNSFLAEKVEYYLTGNISESRTLMQNIKDVPRIIGRQLAILGYYLPRALGLLILFFIPGVQLIAPVLLFLFHAWFIALTYMDYPTDNHRVPIREVREWLDERRWITLGFGASTLVATMIPVLNFFAIPAAVAGATKYWVEQRRK
jgi:CysZ protein